MATITASLFMALDGVDDPGVGNWHSPDWEAKESLPSE